MKNSKTIVESYLKKEDWRVKENSNSPFTVGGMNKYIDGEVCKDYWLRYVYPEYISQAYVKGYIHIHDLGGLTSYCSGYSLREILLKGVRGVSNIPTSSPAKHFDSALNQIANLLTIFQNEIMGAVALNSFDTLLAPFVRADKLTYEEVKQNMQNFIYSINSNSRMGAEPAFTNLTFDITPSADIIDDNVIIGGKFDDTMTYRDFQEEMNMINRAFFEIMLHGDSVGKLFSYPIPTYNIHDRFDWDNPNNELLWEMTGKFGLPYFANYLNSDMKPEDARSMCPLHSTENVLIYDEKLQQYKVCNIKNLYNGSKSEKEYKIFCDGRLKSAKINKFDEINRFYEIELVNGHKIKVSDNHLNITYNGSKKTSELTTEDYLPFNNSIIEGKGLTYKDGLIVGAFLGDGSYKDKNSIVLSLNYEKKQTLMNDISYDVINRLGAKTSIFDCTSQISGKQSCVNLTIHSKFVRGLCEEFVENSNALDKSISTKVLNKSVDFRKGIIDGYYATDGGNRNRIYTSSYNMVKSLCLLFSSLGICTNVTVDDRTIEQGHLSNNPVYCVRYYSPNSNRNKQKDVYIKENGMTWFKIKNIEEIKGDVGFCFEVLEDDEPIFMMPNGLITHNCRLRLDLTELRKRNGGLFGSGDSTGSIGVVTINLPKIAYENKGDLAGFYDELDYYLRVAKESLMIKRDWLNKEILAKKAMPAFIEYVGGFDNYFSTIGDIGKNEMCVNFMGKDITTPEGKAFAEDVGEFFRNKLVEFQKETGVLFNYEATPAESTSYRLALLDKKQYPDIFTQGSGEDCYYTNSCHIPVSQITSIDGTFKHQEKLQTQYTGGTVIHLMMEGAISGSQAKAIVKNMFLNYKVPYMSISPISRYCSEHGYINEITDTCPKCGEKLKLYQRITGGHLFSQCQ